MTIEELREILDDYPDDQSVHIRVWLGSFSEVGNEHANYNYVDSVVDKVQQGTDGALLLTGTKRKE